MSIDSTYSKENNTKNKFKYFSQKSERDLDVKGCLCTMHRAQNIRNKT